MQRFYSKLMRKSYRTLRNPRIRKVSWLNKIVLKFFNRNMWKPSMRRIAVGLSIGLFCAMLPIPFQMLLAAISCYIGRGNIPIAITACWVSNPISQVPLMLFQEQIGSKIRSVIEIQWLDFIDIERTFPFFDKVLNLANFAVGVATTAIFLAIIAYPIVFFFYAIVPKKHLQEIVISKHNNKLVNDNINTNEHQ